jgi:hypothetical protein
MRTRRLAFAMVLLLTACSSSNPAARAGTPPETAPAGSAPPPAGTSADWPMYHGTPDHAGRSATTPAAGTPKLAQALKLDGKVYASPLVVRGLTIVATENDAVYPTTGSPVIGGGRVWALDPKGGVLHALDPATGKSVGQVTVGETSRFATPALSGSNVIVPTLTGIVVFRA